MKGGLGLKHMSDVSLCLESRQINEIYRVLEQELSFSYHNKDIMLLYCRSLVW